MKILSNITLQINHSFILDIYLYLQIFFNKEGFIWVFVKVTFEIIFLGHIAIMQATSVHPTHSLSPSQAVYDLNHSFFNMVMNQPIEHQLFISPPLFLVTENLSDKPQQLKTYGWDVKPI